MARDWPRQQQQQPPGQYSGGDVKTKKRTEITVETHRLLVMRKPTGTTQTWCARCCEQVEMATPERAALLAGVSLRAICRQVEANSIHFVETANGLLLICLNSLLK